jgi:CBS domain-containing protein
MDRISRTAPLGDIIMSILDSGLRTTAVVSDDSILIGVVTEGDIVRAIARGSGPGLTAEDLMNRAPGLLVEPVSDEALVRQFLEHGRLAVPVVDSLGRLLRLESTAAAVQRCLDAQ